MEEQFRPRGFTLLPIVVKNLLIINGLFFFAQLAVRKMTGVSLEDHLGLHYFAAQDFRPWQFITYMFLHGDLGHLFFNMLALWMFGYALENIWGPRRFLVYFFVTGIGAALVHYLVVFIEINPTIQVLNGLIDSPTSAGMLNFISQHQATMGEAINDQTTLSQVNQAIQAIGINPDDRQALAVMSNFMVDFKEFFLNQPNVIGASGAVFGILLAFGMLFPNTLIFIYFLFPIKAKYFVILYGAMELFYGISGAASNIAHFAHLGGMIFGFFLIRYWKTQGRLY